MKQRYYIADVERGVFEGPLVFVEARERLRFWIDHRMEIEQSASEEELCAEEIKEKAQRYFYVVILEGRYTEVTIASDQWLTPGADDMEHQGKLRNWFLSHGFHPMIDTELRGYGLESPDESDKGIMYFREPESGQIYSGRFADESSIDGAKRYLFKPYQS